MKATLTLLLMAMSAIAEPLLTVQSVGDNTITIKIDNAPTAFDVEQTYDLSNPSWHTAQWIPLVNTNVLLPVDSFTNYGDRFTWNPGWEYLGFQNELMTGAFTNTSGYYVGTDENGIFVDIGCDAGPSVCDNAENENYLAFSFSYNPVGVWDWGGGTFRYEAVTNVVVLTVTNMQSFFRLKSN